MPISLNGDGIVSGVTTFTTPLTGVTTFSSVDATSVVVGSAVTINSSGINIGVSTFYGDASGLTNVPAGSSVTGDFTITNGNVVVSSGYGIDFSADGNVAGMTSELLDDYEEGTFTATFNGTTYSTTGYYTKIGRLVHVLVYGSGMNVTSSVTAHIFGLPFTVRNNYSVAAVTHNTYTNNNGGNAYFSVSSTQMTCVTANSISNSSTNINSNAYIMISGCYETDT